MTSIKNDIITEQSGFELPIIIAVNTLTGKLITPAQLEQKIKNFLTTQAHIQQELINTNINTLPNKQNQAYGSKWARDNIKTPDGLKLPDNYIEKYWTLTTDKIEAARLILAHKQRLNIYNIIQKLGPDVTLTQITDKTGKHTDWRLIKNIQAMKHAPQTPQIKHPRFPTNQTSSQFCQMKTYKDIIHLHNLAIGPDRYDILFYAAQTLTRYENMSKITRPTIRWGKDNHIHFDFSVIEKIPEEEKNTTSIVAFDRNMDHNHCISDIRMHENGTMSKELGPSLQTLGIIQHEKKLKTERDRCLRKRDRLMPWDVEHYAVLSSQIDVIDSCIESLKEALDWSEVCDILGHVLVGECVGVEQLDMFGGGFVKFRHGSTDDKLEHVCARAGKELVRVNPAGSSCKCPVCGARLRRVRGTDVESCPVCSHEQFHDHGAACVLSVRTMDKVKDCKNWAGRGYVSFPSVSVVEERSRRKREKRYRKMCSRAERGCRTYRIKNKPSPSCPARVRSCKFDSCSSSVLSLSELRGLFLMAFSDDAECEREVGHVFDAGRADRALTLGLWDSTNVIIGGIGFWTCYAYIMKLLESRHKEMPENIANTII